MDEEGFDERDMDIPASKLKRRSSILKLKKIEEPVEPVKTIDSNYSRATRRVSFASSSTVKPFAADPDENTIWDNTYEEEVDHTDSTKSSSGIKTCILLNSTSTYATSVNNVSRMPRKSKRQAFSETIYTDVMELTTCVINPQQIRTIQNNPNLLAEKENIIPICTENDMEMTTCANDNIILARNMTLLRNFPQEQTLYNVDDMEITCPLNAQVIIRDKLNSIPNNKSCTTNIDQSIHSDNMEIEMDFTESIPVEILKQQKNIIQEATENVNAQENHCRSNHTIDKENVSEHLKNESTRFKVHEETLKNTNSSVSRMENSSNKVLYSEPLRIIKNRQEPPKILEDSNVENFDDSLTSKMNVNNTKTMSFNINVSSSPCAEDTQQLIRATCSGRLNESNLFSPREIRKDFEEFEETNSICGRTFTKPFNNSKLTSNDVESVDRGTDKTFLVGKQGKSDEKLEESKKIYEESLLDDMTPTMLIQEDDKSIEITNSSFSCEKIDKSNDNIIKMNNSVSCSFLRHVQEKLIQYEAASSVSSDKLNRVLGRMNTLSNESNELLKSYKSLKINWINLERTEQVLSSRDCASNSNSFSSISTDVSTEGENSSMEVPANVKVSIYDKIVDASQRCKNYWKLEKVDDERCVYSFSALYRNILITAGINKENGLVRHMDAVLKLGGLKDHMKTFTANYLIQRLKSDNLNSVLGSQYDIVSLLDYVYMLVDQIFNFHSDFLQLQKDFRTLQMESDSRIVLKILDVKHIISWKVTITPSALDSVHSSEVNAVAEIGEKINELHVKKLADSVPKGPKWLRSFLSKLNSYYKDVTKKLDNRIM